MSHPLGKEEGIYRKKILQHEGKDARFRGGEYGQGGTKGWPFARTTKQQEGKNAKSRD